MLLALLKQTITERGFTLAALGAALTPARDASWLSRALRGERRLPLKDIDQILELIGEPPAHFYQRHLSAIGGQRPPSFGDIEPAHLLRTIAGEPDGVPTTIEILLQSSLPTLDRDAFPTLPSWLRNLDLSRQHDPEAAFERALDSVQDYKERLFARRHDRRTLAELTAALGAFASAARSRGKSRLAAQVLGLAFERVGSAQSGVLFADLLYRSGAILIDGGFPTVAVSFLERALALFTLFEQPRDEVKVLLALGVQSQYVGRSEIAKRCFSRCLQHQAADLQSQAMALGNLAWLHELQQEPEKALALLNELDDVLEDASPRITVSARWIKARALGQCGELTEASEYLAGLTEDVATYCDPVDPFLLFCDRASVLVRLGRFHQLRKTAAEASEYLERLERTPLVEQVAREALEHILRRSVNSADIRRIRRQLMEASGRS